MKEVAKGVPRKALLLGHFSTVGDIGCLNYVIDCLRELGMAYDLCAFMKEVRNDIPGSLAPAELRPKSYTHLVFICGPCWPELFARNGIDLRKFSHCCRIGINTTMIEPVRSWNPFTPLLERDSDRQSRPDLCFFTPVETVPTVGLCLIGEQGEYGERQRHKETIEMIHAALTRLGWARLDLDTKWPRSRNTTNIHNPAEFFSLVQKVDLVITNRLHGLVFALKGRVPVLAVDSIVGGDKVTRQALALGWPRVFPAETLSADQLVDSARWGVSKEGWLAAQKIAREIKPAGERLRADFLGALAKGEVVVLDAKYPPAAAGPSRQGRFDRLKRFCGL